MTKMEIRNCLDLEMVLSMMAHLVLFPSVYRTAKDHIRNEYFKLSNESDPDDLAELGLMYIWKALKAYHESECSGLPPTKEKLSIYIKQELASSLQNDEVLEEAIFYDDPGSGFLAYIYDDARLGSDEITGNNLVKQFLLERAVHDKFLRTAEIIKRGTNTYDARIGDTLKELAEKAEKYKYLGTDLENIPVIPGPEYYSIQQPPTYSSGIPFIDRGLGGGQRCGAVNAIIGCTGAGKTTLGINILTENARTNHANVLSGIEEPQLCMYYSYEQSVSDLLKNVQSSALLISRATIRNMLTEGFSDSEDNRKPYERELWPDPLAWVPERVRWLEGRTWMNDSIILQNFSGIPDITDQTPEQQNKKRHCGCGGIDEVQTDVARFVEKTHRKVRVIILDYAGLIRHRMGKTENEQEFYNQLAFMGDDCRTKLAGYFNCAVWLLHQIRGASNGMSPLVPLHHSKAAGCSSFADNVDTCLCLGNPDHGSDDEYHSGKCLYATWSKTRYTPGTGFDDANRILQHDSSLYRLKDVTEDYVPDRTSQSFVRRSNND